MFFCLCVRLKSASFLEAGSSQKQARCSARPANKHLVLLDHENENDLIVDVGNITLYPPQINFIHLDVSRIQFNEL